MVDNPALLRLVRVRLARQADLPAMEWQGELVHFRNLFKDAFDQVRQGSGEIWLAELQDLLSENRLLIGQLMLSFRVSFSGGIDSAYLYGFRVKESYRDQGVGSLLMQNVEDHLRKIECRRLTLNVARDNLSARRLYERRFYRVTGQDEGHWFYTDHEGVRREVLEPAWRMEKLLY